MKRPHSGSAGTGKVLVLGDNYRVVLPIVRSLGRKGLKVHVAWCPPDSPALRSKYVACTHSLPAYAPDDDAWCTALRELGSRERFDLIIPSTEFENLACQSRRAALEPDLRLAILSPDAYRATSDKVETGRLARAVGVPYPSTVTVSDTDDLERILATLTPPAVVKPCSSNTRACSDKEFVQRVTDGDEMRRAVRVALLSQPRVLVQELVPGRGVGVEVLAHEGTILFSFQHDRLHETTGYGSAYRVSVPVNADLLDAARRLLGAIRYTGVGMIEFRVDPERGHWCLLEINGRFWGSLPLAVASGADFPYFLYEMLVRGRTSFPQAYRLGIRSRDLSLGLLWFARQIMPPRDRRDQGWDIARVPRPRLVADMFRAVTFRDRIDTFDGDDLRPGFAELRTIFMAVIRDLLERARPRTRAGEAGRHG